MYSRCFLSLNVSNYVVQRFPLAKRSSKSINPANWRECFAFNVKYSLILTVDLHLPKHFWTRQYIEIINFCSCENHLTSYNYNQIKQTFKRKWLALWCPKVASKNNKLPTACRVYLCFNMFTWIKRNYSDKKWLVFVMQTRCIFCECFCIT